MAQQVTRLVACAALALAAALATAPLAAQQNEAAYRALTAGELNDGIMNGGLAAWVNDPAERTTLSTFMATSYVLGVADGGKGTQWCPPETLHVHVLMTAVMDHLTELPKARQSAPAAAAIGEALGKAYPCR